MRESPQGGAEGVNDRDSPSVANLSGKRTAIGQNSGKASLTEGAIPSFGSGESLRLINRVSRRIGLFILFFYWAG